MIGSMLIFPIGSWSYLATAQVIVWDCLVCLELISGQAAGSGLASHAGAGPGTGVGGKVGCTSRGPGCTSLGHGLTSHWLGCTSPGRCCTSYNWCCTGLVTSGIL